MKPATAKQKSETREKILRELGAEGRIPIPVDGPMRKKEHGKAEYRWVPCDNADYVAMPRGLSMGILQLFRNLPAGPRGQR